MKIAIISDIHDNIPNLQKVLDYLEKGEVEKIICCGDVTNIDTISKLSKGFLGNIVLVKGNADNWYKEELKNFKNIDYLGRKGGVVDVPSLRIGVCHEPFLCDDLIKNNKPNIIFYGHTHKPWEEERDGVLLVNPGTLGGMFLDGTFALYDTDISELKLRRVN